MPFRRPILLLGWLAGLCACTDKAPPMAAATIGGAGVSSATFRTDSERVIPSIVNVRWLAADVNPDAKAWSLLKETDSAQWCGGEITWCHSVALSGWIGAVGDRPRGAPHLIIIQDAVLVLSRFHIPVLDPDDAIAMGQRELRARDRPEHLEGDGPEPHAERHREPPDEGEPRILHEHAKAQLHVERQPAEPFGLRDGRARAKHDVTQPIGSAGLA